MFARFASRLALVVATLALAACAVPGTQAPGAMEVRQGKIVRTNSGVLVSVTQAANPGLRVGQRVYIEGSGEGARVMAQ